MDGLCDPNLGEGVVITNVVSDGTSQSALLNWQLMDKRFSSLFNLTEEQAIEILDRPATDSDEASSRYIAASHLANFDTERSVAALMRAVNHDAPDLDNRIVRRKALESLGRLKVSAALPVIERCLADDDSYLVENAAWALGEIGTDNTAILEKLAEQLDRPEQSYRTIIHALASLGYAPAAERIEKFTVSEQAPIASAAFSAVYQLKGDQQAIHQVLSFLQSPNVNARRGSIQDLIDARYVEAIPKIAQCPVSMVFRLRGIRLLAEAAIQDSSQADQAATFAHVQPALETTLRDHPSAIAFVHQYEQRPDVQRLVQDLYGTDFGRCYLASQTLIDHYAEAAPAALIDSYETEGYNDYGAHYHIMRLFGWLRVSDAYDLLVTALHNKAPQFQKSRVAAAVSLGELGDARAIDELNQGLTAPIWDVQYAILMALEKLRSSSTDGHPPASASRVIEQAQSQLSTFDWLVQEKLKTM
ncbi:MAG: HEAT repeat domain-containing protein [Phormidesmis sp.]